MKLLTVEVHKWLTFSQLIHLYSVGQMAPGPNMMMIVALGQWAVELSALSAALVAFFGPTALLAFIVARAWKKLEKWLWRTSDSTRACARLRSGLLLAGCFTMAKGAISGVETAAIAVGVLLILLQYKVNPALLVLGGAVVGVLSFMPK